MPFQVIGDGGAFANVPSLCSSGGGVNLASVFNLGANGIIGVGVTMTPVGDVYIIANFADGAPDSKPRGGGS